MYAASRQTHREMTTAHAGLWIDRCGMRGRDISLVLKCPTHIGKAIQAGATTRFILADVPSNGTTVRCLGFQVDDRAGKPFTTYGAYRLRGEQRLLIRLFKREELALYVFDEAERCVAACKADLDAHGRSMASDLFVRGEPIYAGRFGAVVTSALDQFALMLEASTHSNQQASPLSVGCELSDWKVSTIYGIGSGRFKLTEDDGGGLEQTAHQLLESLFEQNAFRSPRVADGSNDRELIDSLLIGDHVLFLVEAKAIGFSDQTKPPSPDRLARSVRKDVDKGLRQLMGAKKAIRRGAAVSETHQEIPGLARTPRRPINIPDRDWVVIGIVVVSDLECGVDWQDVAKNYIAASDDAALYQVVDLTELRSLVGRAKNPVQFMTNAILRWHQAREHGTMGMRVRIRRDEPKTLP